MPLKLPDNLPSIDILKQENIFVMDNSRAKHQDIRPLRIVILNLMPLKITTETDLIRLLSNTPLQVEIDFLKIDGHNSKNTPIEHMQAFYKKFESIKNDKYDGMIITGAPVEHLEFEEVTYWNEFKTILDWSVGNVTSTMFICWAAQAGLNHFYNIPKHPLKEKMFGIFTHTSSDNTLPIFRGFDDEYYIPHSRHTEIKEEEIENHPDLKLLSSSEDAGAYMIMAREGRQLFVTGHAEYSRNTLDTEYKRDLQKGKTISLPKNYYPKDDADKMPLMRWKSHANLLFSNWLNYYVYQKTPYDISRIR